MPSLDAESICVEVYSATDRRMVSTFTIHKPTAQSRQDAIWPIDNYLKLTGAILEACIVNGTHSGEPLDDYTVQQISVEGAVHHSLNRALIDSQQALDWAIVKASEDRKFNFVLRVIVHV